MEKTKNIHAGHRSRLREQLEVMPTENISDLHFLEYILTFVIPRADTNPIAHALLEEFKTITAIYNATYEALISVPGVGPKTANFIKSFNLIYYMKNRTIANKNCKISTLGKAIEYIKNILPPTHNEQFIVIITGKNFEVKTYKIFKGISHSYIAFDLKELSEYLIKNKASFCFMAHTHPEHKATPSPADYDACSRLLPLLDSLSIQLIDNVVLGEENFYSFKLNSLREYDDFISTTAKSMTLANTYLNPKKFVSNPFA